MFKNPGAFKDISTGIQSIVLTIAVLVGGCWTLFTFSALKAKNKAEAEIAGMLQTNEKVKADLFRQSIMDIKLQAVQLPATAAEKITIAVTVNIANKGNTNAFIDFSSKPPLKVSSIQFNENGSSVKTGVFDQEDYDWNNIVVRAGASMSFTSFVKVPGKGLYVMDYSLPLDEADTRVDSLSRKKTATVFWPASTYVLVR